MFCSSYVSKVFFNVSKGFLLLMFLRLFYVVLCVFFCG